MTGPVTAALPQATDEKSAVVLQGDGVGDSPSVTEVLEEKPKRTWRSYLWDTFDKSPEERRFLFKLDAVLMTLASLGYFIKYLDQVCHQRMSLSDIKGSCSVRLNKCCQVNINNAFVSGMKEDLSLFGNELNYVQVCWTVGYVVGEIPRYD